MARIGFIGTGHMARVIINLMAPKGHPISVTHRGRATSQAPTERYSNVMATEAEAVVQQSDILFLCLRPDQAEHALSGMPYRSGHIIVSVMAGISVAMVARVCAPARRCAAILPMELLERGGCPVPIYPDMPEIAALFEPENTVIALPGEEALAACFAATTLTSAVAEVLDLGTRWLAQHLGAEAAQRYVGGVVPGMLDVHATQPERFARLRDSLATEGTLNLSMVEALRDNGLEETLQTELTALKNRASGDSRA